MTVHDRDLGMGRDISRRDFLNGVAVTVTGSLATRAAFAALGGGEPTGEEIAPPEWAADYYPPSLTGMRGSHPGSFEVAHELRDGRASSVAAAAADSGESYDLVVVGGGISGLSAAFFYRAAAGTGARILVLDNHDDFGGHAKRNEFSHGGRMLMLNGGTLNIEGPGEYSATSMGLLRAIGIDVDRFEREIAPDHDVYRSLGLGGGVWFNRERFGADRLVAGAPWITSRGGAWPEFLARTPLAEQARKDIARIQSVDQPDYLPGLGSGEKKRQLQRMSYQAFLVDLAKVHPDAVWFHQTASDELFLMHIDGLPAYYAWNMGYPGFAGMHLDPTPPDVLLGEPGGAHGRENQARADAAGRAIHFPDGNATIARLLVRALLPEAVPGHSQEDVVTTRVDYSRLDRPGNAARIRLNSTVVNVAHEGDSETATDVVVTYVKGGQASRVRAGNVVLACWNSMIPHLCPELPTPQKEALAYGIKGPLVYTSVLIREWTSFAKLGVWYVGAPGGFHSSVMLAEPVSIGDYRASRTPSEPMVLHLVRAPCAPGLARKEQHRRGRAELLATPFERFEREIRDQLGRMLQDGGFDPARDIEAITVNRWPHGYTYNYNTLSDPVEWALGTPDDRPCVVGRRRFGRIAIANADAAGSSHTDAAIDMAHRAVEDLVAGRGVRAGSTRP